MTFTTIARTDVGRERDHNEDSVYTDTSGEGAVLAVADGMGGHEAGDVASQTAIEAFEAAIADATPTSADEILEAALMHANEAVQQAAQDARGRGRMGTTLVAALVRDGTVTIGNVGDSRAYDITEAEIDQITVDQSLVRELVEQGAISEDEMADHPQRNVLSQSLGSEDDVEPDLYERELSGTLLLCSDGLTEEVADPTIHELVTSAQSLEMAAENLIERANENGGSDNISVVLGCRT